MKVIIASDSFKGSLSSGKIAELAEKVLKKYAPDCDVRKILIADGGEGTAEAFAANCGGKLQKVWVEGPLGVQTQAQYCVLPDGTCVIEMAEASGLTRIDAKDRDPLAASTYGTGQLIRAALDQGCRKIVLAVGGSATNDGGMGAMSALGVRFLDKDGNRLKGSGAQLESVAQIDLSEMDERLQETTFTLMCDVKNPLLGETGATYVYGPQKGADEETLVRLEAGMENYARKVRESLHTDIAYVPGGGAAGGLGAAAIGFLHARMKLGIDVLLETVDFDTLIEDSDFIITGEGNVDAQSAYGKVLYGIGTHAAKKQVPVYAIVGGMGEGARELYKCGITSIIPTVNRVMTLAEAMERAEELYTDAAERLLRIVL